MMTGRMPPLATATWQLVFGLMFIAAGTFVFEGAPRFNLSFETWAAILFVGVIGTGFAHFLWWSIAGRLSPITASIGSLLVPVIGVLGSVALLGERPSLNDIVGFVLILGSAITGGTTSRAVVLRELRVDLWWGGLLTAIGLFYTVRFRPSRKD